MIPQNVGLIPALEYIPENPPPKAGLNRWTDCCQATPGDLGTNVNRTAANLERVSPPRQLQGLTHQHSSNHQGISPHPAPAGLNRDGNPRKSYQLAPPRPPGADPEAANSSIRNRAPTPQLRGSTSAGAPSQAPGSINPASAGLNHTGKEQLCSKDCQSRQRRTEPIPTPSFFNKDPQYPASAGRPSQALDIPAGQTSPSRPQILGKNSFSKIPKKGLHRPRKTL